jgi:hypothetical protein
MADEINRRRIDKATDNQEITPIQMLRYLADEIERGKLNCSHVAIVVAFMPNDKEIEHEHSTWWAGGVRWVEGIGLLSLAVERSIRRYRGFRE